MLVVVVVGATLTACGQGSLGARHGTTSSSSAAGVTEPPTTAAPVSQWRTAWGSAMAWGYGEAVDTTVRQVVTVAVGGTALRVRLSNLYGNRPLILGGATVAPAGPNGSLAGPGEALLFAGQSVVSIPVGQEVYSDPVLMPVSAGQSLAVSVFVRGLDLMTVHPCCVFPPVSYFAGNYAGDLITDASAGALPYSSPWSRLVDAIDVLSPAGPGIAVLGDSISDGYNSSGRWPELLQQRIDLLPPADRVSVVNEAITANTLTVVPRDDELKGGGPPGLTRLVPDIIDLAGISDVVVLLGTNDLWFGASASQLIAGYTQLASTLHSAGKRLFIATLLPRQTGTELWTPAQQAALVQVDQWILGSGLFDGVIDLAAAVADVYNGACQPDALYPAFDSGDHLHPDAAGDVALANAVPTALFGLPPAPQLAHPPMTPTPGCDTPGPGYPPPPVQGSGAPGQPPGA
ncbi:MAG: GDSL-type esterase/lipase family protein [Acidimicrobiales bacterium]